MTPTSNRYQVSIEADPTLPIIRMTRDFDATPADLMRAHTDPELFARWVGPDGMDTKILDWDATTVGRWRYVAGRDGEEYGFHGCFHEVGEDRIVQTFTFDGQPDDVALETLWFEDLGDGRTRLHAQSLVDSFEGRDQWLASDMETGVEHRTSHTHRSRQSRPRSRSNHLHPTQRTPDGNGQSTTRCSLSRRLRTLNGQFGYPPTPHRSFAPPVEVAAIG